MVSIRCWKHSLGNLVLADSTAEPVQGAWWP
uniref:Uncharacterized protein n=1 Tax=Anguilla anguilla TaxID=7936 RepID=A0A0E9Q0X2_ANGAN